MKWFRRRRFPQRASFTASPWAYNGKLFVLDESGDRHARDASRPRIQDREEELAQRALHRHALDRSRQAVDSHGDAGLLRWEA
jgi:hypothetical protein